VRTRGPASEGEVEGEVEGETASSEKKKVVSRSKRAIWDA